MTKTLYSAVVLFVIQLIKIDTVEAVSLQASQTDPQPDADKYVDPNYVRPLPASPFTMSAPDPNDISETLEANPSTHEEFGTGDSPPFDPLQTDGWIAPAPLAEDPPIQEIKIDTDEQTVKDSLDDDTGSEVDSDFASDIDSEDDTLVDDPE